MFLQVDGTIVIQLLNFAIFFALLSVVFLRPVSRAISERRRYINSVTEDCDRYHAEAAALRTQAESLRAAARKEAEEAIAAARADASNASAEIAAQTARQSAQIVDEARRTVAAELEAARRDEARAVIELAELLVRRALAEHAQ